MIHLIFNSFRFKTEIYFNQAKLIYRRTTKQKIKLKLYLCNKQLLHKQLLHQVFLWIPLLKLSRVQLQLLLKPRLLPQLRYLQMFQHHQLQLKLQQLQFLHLLLLYKHPQMYLQHRLLQLKKQQILYQHNLLQLNLIQFQLLNLFIRLLIKQKNWYLR